jgi:formamidopyrimidine-DNA glycosylase
MPELPDLVYIRNYLAGTLPGRHVADVTVKRPVVFRTTIDHPIGETLAGTSVRDVSTRGPFIRIGLSDSIDIIINLMLAGKLQHQREGERQEAYTCGSLNLDDRSRLNICDEQQMAKVYVVRAGEYTVVPKYLSQGIDILSEKFTLEKFKAVATTHRRKQVRVFLNDQTALSAIGNAYADEVLFEAGIHPKTFVNTLTEADIARLYRSIITTMEWGIEQVRAAAQPIHVKVRDHMRIRNRKGEPCPRCGTTIRREGVRGYDVFFCPQCQPASRAHFIDWRTLPQ